MDNTDAITLLYLLKNWDEPASLLDCATKFQQTKDELKKTLAENSRLAEAIENGTFGM